MKNQRAPLFVAAVFIYLPVLLLLLATGMISVIKEVPIKNFMRDTTAVARAPFYIGAISNIGVLLWCATASMCFLTSSVLHRASTGTKEQLFFLWAALITAVLMIDDLFLVHETVAPRFLAVSSDSVFVIYGILTSAFLLYYRRLILQTDYILLLLGILFLAGSVAFDMLSDNNFIPSLKSTGMQNYLEDSSKLLGIAGWFSYFGRECFKKLSRQDGKEKLIAS